MPKRIWQITISFIVAATSSWALAADAQIDAASLKQQHFIYLAKLGEPWPALTQLRANGLAGGPAAARLYADLGLLDDARTALSGWADNDQADSAWLNLANAQYRAKRWQAAAESLSKTTQFLPAPLNQRKASLLARALLDQDRDNSAARTLEALQRRDSLTGVDTYNLGIAWLRSGDSSRGAGLLDSLGSYLGDDALRQALADQANLALGYWFLREQRGGLARAAFARIRLHGPLAENGKVGIGWAELAQAGGLQRLSKTCGAPRSILWGQSSQYRVAPEPGCDPHTDSFTDSALGGAPSRENEQQALRRAAVAWKSATQGNPFSPIVQEALIALPFALKGAGESQAAALAYQNAIKRLQLVEKRLADYVSELRTATATAGRIDTAFSEAADWSLNTGLLGRLDQLQTDAQLWQNKLEYLQLAAASLPANGENTMLRTLGAILSQLREAASDGQAYAVSSPAQRGLMLIALKSGLSPPAESGESAVLRSRLEALGTQVAAYQQRLDAERLARRVAIVETSRAFARARLQEAYAGLADLEIEH